VALPFLSIVFLIIVLGSTRESSSTSISNS
jgi:hypothetical protein